eukprot:11824603-Karenia_brevis.AAC.1
MPDARHHRELEPFESSAHHQFCTHNAGLMYKLTPWTACPGPTLGPNPWISCKGSHWAISN